MSGQPDETFEVVVEAITTEAEGVVSLSLGRTDGGALPAWDPGAHIDLLLENGLERQYSLCGSVADDDRWRVAVLREPESRGGSEWIHSALRPGASLTVRGPRNNFPLVGADRYLFIAGGIGITPLLPMIEIVDARGDDWKLIYGGRRVASMAFDAVLASWPERVTIWPEDTHGILELDRHLGSPTAGTVVYCCGPERLIAAVEERCGSWPAGALRVERFRPREGALEGPDGAFEVVLAQSGRTVGVASGESIVDAVAAVGVDVPTSCREGTCGTCETAVLEGTPDHRDSFLTEEERETAGTMMVCCGRSLTSRLVLDL